MSDRRCPTASPGTPPTVTHPARRASQRSYSAVARKAKDEWLALFADDARARGPGRTVVLRPAGRGSPRPGGDQRVLGHGHRARWWSSASRSATPSPTATRARTSAPSARVLEDGHAGRHRADRGLPARRRRVSSGRWRRTGRSSGPWRRCASRDDRVHRHPAAPGSVRRMRLGVHPGLRPPEGAGRHRADARRRRAGRRRGRRRRRCRCMDHFFQLPYLGDVEEPMLEGYTTLGFLAAHTSHGRPAAPRDRRDLPRTPGCSPRSSRPSTCSAGGRARARDRGGLVRAGAPRARHPVPAVA